MLTKAPPPAKAHGSTVPYARNDIPVGTQNRGVKQWCRGKPHQHTPKPGTSPEEARGSPQGGGGEGWGNTDRGGTQGAPNSTAPHETHSRVSAKANNLTEPPRDGHRGSVRLAASNDCFIPPPALPLTAPPQGGANPILPNPYPSRGSWDHHPEISSRLLATRHHRRHGGSESHPIPPSRGGDNGRYEALHHSGHVRGERPLLGMGT